MAYPKDDTDFTDGTVTFVQDKGGEMIMVGHHMPNWGGGYRGCSMQPRPNFEIKEGMRIRIYAFQGLPERGVYIAGRIVRPYRTKAQGRKWIKDYTQAVFAHRRKQRQLRK